jgi:hypothetical protein
MTEATKATRKLSNFNFDYDGAAVALVGPSVGGAANGRTTLLTKSLKDITEEEVSKAAEVTVTMSMVDFLCKFYSLWYEDAIVLAAIFGYQDIEDAYSFQESSNDYEKYLQEKVDAVQIMKSLVMDKGVDEIQKAIGSLSPKDYLSVLKVQEQFEKNYEAAVQKAASCKKASVEIAEELAVVKATKSPSVEINEDGDNMSEFVTKAVHDTAVEQAIQKAKDEVGVELQKAKDELKTLKEEKLQAVAKARKEAVAAVEEDEAVAAELLKSLEAVSDEAFEVVIKSLKAKEEKLDDSELFVQKSKQVTSKEADSLALVGDLINKSKKQ